MAIDTSKIRIGDRVDCGGASGVEGIRCKSGQVIHIPSSSGFDVRGPWEDRGCAGEDTWYVLADQITAHYPAATEQPRSFGDKPASEMTMREKFLCDHMIALSSNLDTTFDDDAANAIDAWEALISALEKRGA